MMKTTLRRLVAVVLLAISGSAVHADFGLLECNCNVVNNPHSGDRILPSFGYDPADGSFWVDNSGDNGIVDSAGNLTLGGDDLGLISFLISFPNDPGPDGIGVSLPVFGDGIAWGAPVWFNNKIQLSGNAIAGSFLPVLPGPTAIFQLPLGLGLSDFTNPSTGLVEMEIGVNHTFGAPGETLFCTFGIPEPAGMGLLGWGAMFTVLLRRRISLQPLLMH